MLTIRQLAFLPQQYVLAICPAGYILNVTNNSPKLYQISTVWKYSLYQHSLESIKKRSTSYVYIVELCVILIYFILLFLLFYNFKNFNYYLKIIFKQKYARLKTHTHTCTHTTIHTFTFYFFGHHFMLPRH